LRQADTAAVPMLSDMDFKKILLYGGGLLLATTGPISLFTASDHFGGIRKSWFPSAGAAVSAQSAPPAAIPQPGTTVSVAAGQRSAAPLPAAAVSDAALPSPSMAEALSFDVTADWIMRRWPRVSAGLAQVQLQGYRVPLVTGTSIADLAGSLTYYFTPQQHVQRITFRGTTGDPGALLALLANRYRFTRRLTNDPGVILYETVDSSNRTMGTAKIRSAKVIKANQPYTRFDVELAIDRPE
jgi:hypothetical protein